MSPSSKGIGHPMSVSYLNLPTKPQRYSCQYLCYKPSLFTLFLLLICLFPLFTLRKPVNASKPSALSLSREQFYAQYHSVRSLHGRITQIQQHCRDAQVETIAYSHEGRPIHAVILGTTAASTPSRFLITAGMHGRERSTSMVALYAIEQFCEQHEHQLKRIQGIFVPVVNPDGMEYSRTISRAWRKNVSPNHNATRNSTSDGPCIGVDLNRNWPTYWGMGNGSSHNPCHETYIGPYPLSEPENMGIATLLSHNRGIAAHVDIHSFGQFLYRSFAYKPGTTLTQRRTEGRQRRAARAMRVRIRSVFGTDMWDISARIAGWHVGRKRIGGSFLDYMMQRGIASITMELGPRMTEGNKADGFFTREEEIVRRCKEVFEGLKVVLEEADPRQKVREYSDKEIGIVLP